MIASRPAIFAAVFCLLFGSHTAVAQSSNSSNAQGSQYTQAGTTIPALRPYITEQPDNPLPRPVAALHPPVPARVPVEQAVTVHPSQLSQAPAYTAAPFNGSNTKPCLAWRARAYKLNHGTDLVPSRQLACNHDDAVMALLAVLPAYGLKVETLNSKAGELLAAPMDPASKQRFIFTICETTSGNVTLKGTALYTNKQSAETVQKILAGPFPDAQRRGTL